MIKKKDPEPNIDQVFTWRRKALFWENALDLWKEASTTSEFTMAFSRLVSDFSSGHNSPKGSM